MILPFPSLLHFPTPIQIKIYSIISNQNTLAQNGLILALISVVSGEALAKALRVIADSTSTAVPSLGVSVSEEDIVT